MSIAVSLGTYGFVTIVIGYLHEGRNNLCGIQWVFCLRTVAFIVCSSFQKQNIFLKNLADLGEKKKAHLLLTQMFRNLTHSMVFVS